MNGREIEKWLKVFKADYMSSEESENEEWYTPITVKPLLWRSAKVQEMLQRLDQKSLSTKNGQGLRQKRARVVGIVPSNRTAPADSPKWALS